VEGHIEKIIKTYLKYLICPEVSLAIYGLLEEVDDYIDNRLKKFPLNKVQKLKVKSIFRRLFKKS
jgi:hypothetical protein